MQVRQAEYGPEVRPPRVAPRLSVVAAGAGVLTQIAYPLLCGPALTGVTVLTVALLDVAVLAHATASFGAAAAARFAVAIGGLSLLAEAVGVHTGIPFGAYGYSGDLGVRLLGVPLVVLGAWTMMAYPCVLLARRLTVPGRTSTRLTPTGRGGTGLTVPGRTRTRLRVALLGGITLASWDLFLDPQLVTAGLWTWHHPTPGLPGVPGVPLTNLAGWLLVGTALAAVLDRLLPPVPRPGAGPGVPAALLAWTWLGSTLANAAFFGRPALAGYGFVALGVTVAPYLLAVREDLVPSWPGAGPT